MGARTAERVMPPFTQTASEALWGRSFSSADASASGRGGHSTSSRLDDNVVVLLSDETAASEAAPLVSHNAVKLAFCGGVSGALAKTCTAPLARLTILYQVKGLALAGPGAGGPQLGVFAALRHIMATEGIGALWKGNLVTIMHRIPYSATNFFTYESTKRALQGRLSNESARAWAAGAMSGLVACTAAYPLDLLRTRIAAEIPGGPRADATPHPSHSHTQQPPSHQQQPRQPYRRVPAALCRIVSEQGVRGLYKGLGATLVQVVPGLAFNFCFYDTFKGLILRHQLNQAPHPNLNPNRSPQQHRRGSCRAVSSSSPPPPHQLNSHPERHLDMGSQHHEQQQQQSNRSGAGWSYWSSSCGDSDSMPGAAGVSGGGGGGGAQCARPGSQGSHGSVGGGPNTTAAGAPSPLTSAACACLSGLCTSSITFPLDVVRRRLQVYERGALGRLRYLDVVRGVYLEGGVAAFYRGLGPEFLKVLPGMAIAFTTYETMKQLTRAT